MKIISVNVNGIRAAQRKGFFDWLDKQNADVVCMQEIKAQEDQLDPEIFKPKGWFVEFFPAKRKGYSGTAIYSRKRPDKITKGLNYLKNNWQMFDDEGRYIQADFGDLSVGSLYMPSGSAKEERQQYKYKVMGDFEKIMRAMLKDGRKYVLCGDWNIAHKNIDIKNWRGNQKNSGFLPEERAWLDKLFEKMGWVDAFRVINQEEHQYTWWSNRGQAWANNTGWRIDYHIVTPNLTNTIKSSEIYKEERFSDHSPLILQYDL